MKKRKLLEILKDLHDDTNIIIKDSSTDDNFEFDITQPCPTDGSGSLVLEINTGSPNVDS
jgi:hypothetical protein